MRTNIDIDDTLMAEAQKASGRVTENDTVEQALGLMIRLRQQAEVADAFGKYRWRGNLNRGRQGAASGDGCRWQRITTVISSRWRSIWAASGLMETPIPA